MNEIYIIILNHLQEVLWCEVVPDERCCLYPVIIPNICISWNVSHHGWIWFLTTSPPDILIPPRPDHRIFWSHPPAVMHQRIHFRPGLLQTLGTPDPGTHLYQTRRPTTQRWFLFRSRFKIMRKAKSLHRPTQFGRCDFSQSRVNRPLASVD